jgi:hypothetical protein
MLDNLALGIKAEDIDARGFVTKQIQVAHMDKGQVVVNGDPLHLVANAANLLEKAHNAVEPVWNERIVLNVESGDEIGIQISSAFIEDLFVPESGVKIAISDLDRFQQVNLAQDVIGQIL